MRLTCANRRNGAPDSARDCPHSADRARTRRVIGVELMQRAAELDHLQEDRDAERSTRE